MNECLYLLFFTVGTLEGLGADCLSVVRGSEVTLLSSILERPGLAETAVPANWRSC